MKVAITGHADGLGAVVAEHFENQGYVVVGFSLENGYDITKKEDRLRMVPEIAECDIFINCAYSREVNDISQCHLLIAVFGLWKDQDKHIISMGSIAPDWKKSDYDFMRMIYRGAKAALDTVNDELAYGGRCRVTNIRPDWLKSKELERLEALYQRKAKNPLDYDDIASLMMYVVDMGKRGVTLTSITLKGNPE